jgi:hypothetical protein
MARLQAAAARHPPPRRNRTERKRTWFAPLLLAFADCVIEPPMRYFSRPLGWYPQPKHLSVSLWPVEYEANA